MAGLQLLQSESEMIGWPRRLVVFFLRPITPLTPTNRNSIQVILTVGQSLCSACGGFLP